MKQRENTIKRDCLNDCCLIKSNSDRVYEENQNYASNE